jgi:hypothetical protein
LTVALARAEFGGALSCIAVLMFPDATASCSSAETELTALFISASFELYEMSNAMLVEPDRRLEYTDACIPLI